ncbi:MAG: VOC family protein [Fimbriimonas ginsengisoli]|uniref:VOC family protein n=1 Tax=Fimbriimonas ginsengisoli TaxID=1005039 RepID=A0A931PU75_FIMGI|nr:VOC family protein [Fimbriimonas ginsengisoli]MBI3721102.1 VOC family protein [Fimbriimonas ginsengisoli]
MPKLLGIHHVTAICGDAQRNVDFYTGVLGLRLTKLTVNFDDPTAYHLYYSDAVGSPGSAVTFFAYPGAYDGRPGPPQAVSMCFEVPTGALGFWQDRLSAASVDVREIRPGVIAFSDPDGLGLEIEEGSAPIGVPWTGAGIDERHAIRRISGVTLRVRHPEPTEGLLDGPFGATADAGRFQVGESWVNVEASEQPHGRVALGSIHHVAFRTKNEAEQLEWRRLLEEALAGVSPVMDRTYFRSIYFREPGGVLFEIATDGPGFNADEPLERLGSSLTLPPFHEHLRAEIERSLPKLRLPEANLV